MRKQWMVALAVLSLLSALSLRTPVLAQGEGPPQDAPSSLVVFTRYPAQETAVGEEVTLDLKLRTDASPQVVRLEVQGLPEGWTATFKGGGDVVRAVYVEPDSDALVVLRVEPPDDIRPGAYRFTVVARGEKEEAQCPIELVVKEKLPPSLELEVELPVLRGAADTTFYYNATLTNKGDEDLSVNLVADAPPELQVSFRLTGKEVTNIPLAANESKRLSVEVRPFAGAPAGSYQINLLAQGGEARAQTTLTAEVTGQPQLSISALDGRLSGEAYAGKETSLTIVVANTGSAPARNVELSASTPAGWSVEFEPQKIAEIPTDQQVEVTAKMKPSDQAVAGDYMVTLRARPEGGASESAEFRITVLTSTLWGIVGVALIAVAVGVVSLAVTRFGRR